MQGSLPQYVQINRKGLPRHQFDSTAEFVEPTTPIERIVQAAWQSVLQLPDSQAISATANFFQVRTVLLSCVAASLGRTSRAHYLYWTTQ